MDETPEIPETPEPFREEDLSAEDLAILRDFDAMEFISLDETLQNAGTRVSTSSSLSADTTEEYSPEDMFLLFISEVEEDVRILRNGIQSLESRKLPDVARLHLLEHKAHKIKGTAGAFGSNALSNIARYTETLLRLLVRGSLRPLIGLDFLVQAISALEATLASLVTAGEESRAPLGELEAAFKARNIDIADGTLKYIAEEDAFDLEAAWNTIEASAPVPLSLHTLPGKEEVSPFFRRQEQAGSPFSVLVELARFEQLLLHSGQLTDLQVSLGSVQQQVEIALQELSMAQARLTRLEALYSTILPTMNISDSPFRPFAYDSALLSIERVSQRSPNVAPDRQIHAGARPIWPVWPASSMIAGILDEAEGRLGHPYERRKDKHGRYTQHFANWRPLYWDELEVDGYTETDTLKNVLSEAIADVATASAQLRAAFAQLNDLLQKQTTQAQNVRSDVLSLRLMPLSVLLARIEQEVMRNDEGQQQGIQFEIEGETTEIDRDILEGLETPLLHLTRTCVSLRLSEFSPLSISPDRVLKQDELPGKPGEESDTLLPGEGRVWFRAQGLGDEVTIEIGTSWPVEGGAVDEVQESIRRLQGSIFAQRNAVGGISFHLRLPRFRGSTRGLLVQVGQHRVIVPFAQIQRIDYDKEQDSSGVYSLGNLLGLPADMLPTHHTHHTHHTHSMYPMRPILILRPESMRLRVQVDDIIGDIEQVIKPLASYLRRPGIAGVVVESAGNGVDGDDEGNVLLVVNLPELIHYATQQGFALSDRQPNAAHFPSTPQQKVVLVADDSISIRQSLLQTLTTAGYQAVDVKDGMEALEYLLDHPLDVLLLDVEMPNLNGYDLLSIMSAHPQLATVKIIMLTSRSSEKHERRALELGAHAYLTKPCPHDVLLDTIQSLLSDRG